MQKHSSLILALGVVVAISCAVGIAVADDMAAEAVPTTAAVPDSTAPTNAATGSIVDAATEQKLRDLGIRLESAKGEGMRTSQAAIRTVEDLPFAQNAGSIDAAFGLLTYDPGNGAQSPDVIVDRPVWFVSVRGVEIRRHGHPDMPLLPVEERDASSGGVHNEMNVIIDDATGEILQMFSFR